MGITIDMFVKTYKATSKAKDKTFEEFIKKHITTKYVPFLTKEVYCESIVRATSFVNDGNIKLVKINSASRYLFFVMRLIELYTDIELPDYSNSNGTNLAADYDKLNEIGAINVLLSAIPETEYAEFSTILDMKMDDLYTNEYSTTALFYNLKNSLSISEDIINSALGELTKQVELEKK